MWMCVVLLTASRSSRGYLEIGLRAERVNLDEYQPDYGPNISPSRGATTGRDLGDQRNIGL